MAESGIWSQLEPEPRFLEHGILAKFYMFFLM